MSKMPKVHAVSPDWNAFWACGRLRPVERSGAPGRPAIYPRAPRKDEVTCGSCLRVLESRKGKR